MSFFVDGFSPRTSDRWNVLCATYAKWCEYRLLTLRADNVTFTAIEINQSNLKSALENGENDRIQNEASKRCVVMACQLRRRATTYRCVFADVPLNGNSLCRLSSNLEMDTERAREKKNEKKRK